MECSTFNKFFNDGSLDAAQGNRDPAVPACGLLFIKSRRLTACVTIRSVDETMSDVRQATHSRSPHIAGQQPPQEYELAHDLQTVAASMNPQMHGICPRTSWIGFTVRPLR
jgi:hypothetical protein